MATKERNQALQLAMQYRNKTDKSKRDMRKLKGELEGKIETVRDFWRNQIIEGQSRSGQQLRVALL